MQQIIGVIRDSIAFLAALIRPTVKSLRDNKGLAVLSVVLAFGLWIFVTDAENPTRTRVLAVDIPVEAVNVPQDVAIANTLAPVRVRVTVAEDVFDSLSTADFEATVDLDGLTVGDYELPVQARALSSRGGLRVESVLPAAIDVQLAQLVSKSVPVVVELEGEVPSGYTRTEADPAEATVIVSGPQLQVDQVSEARGVIDIDGRTQNVDQAVRLVARDNRGTLVPGVTLEPSTTSVSISITQEKFSRPVAIDPQISGAPADGYNVVGISVNPPTVTVRGEQAFIEGTSSIPTRPVDVSGASADVVRSVSLDLPSGAEVSGGVPVVTVTVKIAPALGLATFGVPLTVSGLGASLSIQGALPTVQVTLFGELPALRALSPSDITVAADLNGKDAGTHNITLKVASPSGTSVRTVSPSAVDITLEER